MPAPAILLPRYQELSHCYQLCWVPQQLWQRLESVSADMALVGSLETQDLLGAPPSRYGVALLGLACLTFDCRCFSSNNLYTTFKIVLYMGLVMFGIYSIEHVSAYIFLRAHLPLLLSYYLQVVCFSTCQMFVLPWQPSEAFGSPGGKDAGPNS